VKKELSVVDEEEEARRQVGCLVGVQIDGHLRPESDMKKNIL
jgi:hypothetical protein